jgi:hypothetical protein
MRLVRNHGEEGAGGGGTWPEYRLTDRTHQGPQIRKGDAVLFYFQEKKRKNERMNERK